MHCHSENTGRPLSSHGKTREFKINIYFYRWPFLYKEKHFTKITQLTKSINGEKITNRIYKYTLLHKIDNLKCYRRVYS